MVKKASIEIGNRPIAELRQEFNEQSAKEKPGGFAGFLPPKSLLADWVTHHLDIVVPLELDVCGSRPPTSTGPQDRAPRCGARPER